VDLRLLELFCHVYKARSFSRAARDLGLTQPTISAHMKDFEEQLGAALFNRLGREIEPTAAGRLLYEQALPMMALKRDVMGRMAQFLDRIEGDLLIGASTVPGEYLLPGLLAAFHAAHPGVLARLRISDTAAAIGALRQGEIEMAMVGGTSTDVDLVFEPFANDRLVLVVPARRPWTARREVSLRQLAELPLLLREAGSGTRTVLEQALTQRGRTPPALRVVAELGSTTAIKEAVKQGHGVSFISALAVASERAAGRLRVLPVRGLGPMRRTYYTVVDRRRVLSPMVRAFRATLRARRH
jgi:DNA-binding transcriptional LysR family regulator